MKKVMLLHPLLDLAERALRLPAFFKYGSVQQRFHINQIKYIARPQLARPPLGGRGGYILGGKGVGQYRQVMRHEGRQVELDRPFDIPPDETSQISITPLQRNYLLVGNEFYDNF